MGMEKMAMGLRQWKLSQKCCVLVESPMTSFSYLFCLLCSQCGLLSKGWEMFYAMKEKYGITPRLAHYACMVDLLSHSGNIEEGLEFVNNMPIEPDKRIWGALLAGCRKVHGSDVIAEFAARRLIDLDPENTSYYVFLSNLYAEKNRWEGCGNSETICEQEWIAEGDGI